MAPDHRGPVSPNPDNPSVSLINGAETRKYKVPYAEGGRAGNCQLQELREWWTRSRNRSRKSNQSTFERVAVHLPIIKWLRYYRWKTDILWDFLAGASVAALVVPQSMAYATLAGLPPVYGLYGAFAPVLCYAALGSSRHLAVGPVAVTSLYLGSSLKKIAKRGTFEYERAAIQVAFVAGFLYSAVGIFKLGWITNFLSHSVISGFSTGAAVLIGLSQAKSIFGYSKYTPHGKEVLTHNPIGFPGGFLAPITAPAAGPAAYAPGPAKEVSYPSAGTEPIYTTLGTLFSKEWLPHFQWREFLMGVCFIALLFICKHVGQLRPWLVYIKAIGPLLVVIISIAITNIFQLYKKPHNIAIVGKVPAGLPHQTVTWWLPMPNADVIVPTAVVVCLIDILESISIAKALAYKNNYQLNPTQELRGLGFANIVGAAFNCYTTTGSFSRSAIMDSVGARTQLAGVISGIIVMIVLLCLTPVFTNMPKNAQAAIIISAVSGLFNYTEWWFLWKVNLWDFIIFNVAALGTAFLGVELGLAISIGLSVALVLWRSAFPHTATLGQLPGTTVYRNVKQYPEAQTIDGALLARIDAPIYFANVNPVREALDKYEERARIKAQFAGRELRYLAIDLSPVTDVDGSGIHFLKSWIQDHKKKGVQIILANPSVNVLRRLEIAHIPDFLGREYIVVRMNDAVHLIQERFAEEGGPQKAPLKDGEGGSDNAGSDDTGKGLGPYPDLQKRSSQGAKPSVSPPSGGGGGGGGGRYFPSQPNGTGVDGVSGPPKNGPAGFPPGKGPDAV